MKLSLTGKYFLRFLLSLCLYGLCLFLPKAPFVTAEQLIRILQGVDTAFLIVLLISLGQLLMAFFAPHLLEKKPKTE